MVTPTSGLNQLNYWTDTDTENGLVLDCYPLSVLKYSRFPYSSPELQEQESEH